ncbi:MAG: radical SAM protein, partial [Nevskia sp.]|nr:radical SAM protein [Nevskia sp.]
MSATPVQAPDTIAALAAPLARRVAATSSPRSPQAHLIDGAPDTQLLIVNGTRLFSLPPALAAEFEAVLAAGDENSLTRLIATSGLEAPAAIDDQPLQPMPAHALSLAIAQKCNLGCGYCYAQQGGFGGAAKSMTLDTARAAIDLLLREAEPGGRVNLAFLGGEPLVNRKVLQQATDYAADRAAQRGVGIGFSMTTNGTLLTADDA